MLPMKPDSSAGSVPEEHRPLGEDVRELGALLGGILVEQGGRELFACVEATRLAARRRREGDADAEVELAAILADLTPLQAIEVVRAFSAYFSLVNLAEQVHRIRRGRDYEREGGAAQPGSLRAAVATLAAEGTSATQAAELLARLELCPVFTAHPTEAVRRTLLAKDQRIARALVDRIEARDPTPREARAALERIQVEVAGAWQTDEQLRSQPTVGDEVEHVLFYLTEVLYRVVPVFHERLEEALAATYGPQAPELPLQPCLRFGSWVGGDMDGNPNVGASTFRATLERQRALILRRYRAEVAQLYGRLSQSRARVPVSDELEALLERYAMEHPQAQASLAPRHRDMPYREFLTHVDARLAATAADGERAYADAEALAEDLECLHRSLTTNRGAHAGAFQVRRLLRRVRTFGFHLATLDVRQDSEVHRRAVGALLGDPGFAQRPAGERAECLRRELSSPLFALDVERLEDPELAESLRMMRAIADGRARFGDHAVGPYIISMAQGPDDPLAVLYLARRGGLAHGGQVPIDVAPLFETVEDLEAAPDTLRAMLADPCYRAHLAGRGDAQMVMLGYSDSSKESGIAASRWALQRAQVELIAVARVADVDLRLFHGRGGTASRGGGKPRAAVLAEPAGAVRGRWRVTEQGEIIHGKYGLRAIALRTLELTGGAVLEATAREGRVAEPRADWTEALSEFARSSRRTYRELVVHTPGFVEFFRAATPIDVIERLRIGSRPSARRAQQGIGDLRAIPWVFAWTQNRALVPGWYGVGSALEALLAERGEDFVRQMAAEWPFFANLLADVEMVLAKGDMPIARRYAALAGTASTPFLDRILAEFERTRAGVCRAQGTSELLERDPVLRRAIRLRNPYVDPMSWLQADLLARWRAAGRPEGPLQEALFTTVRGIARGLQNTG